MVLKDWLKDKAGKRIGPNQKCVHAFPVWKREANKDLLGVFRIAMPAGNPKNCPLKF